MEIIRSVTGEKQKQIKYLEIWLVKKNNDNLRAIQEIISPKIREIIPPAPKKIVT